MSRPILVITAKSDLLRSDSLGVLWDVLDDEERSAYVIGLNGLPSHWQGFDTRPDVPLELQSAIPESVLSDAVLVLIDREASDAALSYRLPLVWYDWEGVAGRPDTLPLECRAALVVSSLESSPPTSERARFVSLGATSVSRLGHLFDELSVREARRGVHRVLRAEIFHQHEQATQGVTGIGTVLPPSVAQCFRERVTLRSSGPAEGSSSISDGEQQHAVLSSLRDVEQLFNSQDSFLMAVANLQQSASRDDVLERSVGFDQEGASEWLVRLAARRMLEVETLDETGTDETGTDETGTDETGTDETGTDETGTDETGTDETGTLNDRSVAYTIPDVGGVAEAMGIDGLIRLIDNPKVPDHFWLEALEESGELTKLASRVALARQGLGAAHALDLATLRAGIELIDGYSWHLPLWQAGLKYWAEIVGDPWDPNSDAVSEVPAPVTPLGDLADDEVATLDSTARVALAAGEHQRAIALFEVVRLRTYEGRERPSSTELAARLNVGWALWASGSPRESWGPYLETALSEVMPMQSLVCLRNIISDLVDAAEEKPAPQVPETLTFTAVWLGRLRRRLGSGRGVFHSAVRRVLRIIRKDRL